MSDMSINQTRDPQRSHSTGSLKEGAKDVTSFMAVPTMHHSDYLGVQERALDGLKEKPTKQQNSGYHEKVSDELIGKFSDPRLRGIASS